MAYKPEIRRKSYLKAKDRALEYSKWYSLKRKFNLTKEQYDSMLEKQNHVCAICQEKCSRALAVDHNHETGAIRGLLCSKCNRGIGYLDDDPKRLQKALDYLNNKESNWGSDWVDDGV